MEIVIKMSDEDYEYLKTHNKHGLYSSILNGTVLPKGHGRLVDAEAFQKSYCESNCGNRKCVDAMDECIFIGDLQLAPTIIEADRSEE